MPESRHVSLNDPAMRGQRLDAALAVALPEFSRSRIQALIKGGHIRSTDGSTLKPRQPVQGNEEILVEIPAPKPSSIEPEAMPLDILYEDDDLLVLDKPSGLVVHPGAGHDTGTLVNALLAHCGRLSSIGGVERPGIVHRLDKDTSGCLVVAKNDPSHQNLSEQFANREVTKHYLAVGRGRPAWETQRVENFIGRHRVNRQKMAVVDQAHGKPAITEFDRGHTHQDATMIRCRLFTGRTHQIRVHLHHLGHPLLGDEIYGRQISGYADRLLLHAWLLGIRHPVTGQEMSWRTPIPKAFYQWEDAETIARWLT